MKSDRNLHHEVCSVSNLHAAARNAMRGKLSSPAPAAFHSHLEIHPDKYRLCRTDREGADFCGFVCYRSGRIKVRGASVRRYVKRLPSGQIAEVEVPLPRRAGFRDQRTVAGGGNETSSGRRETAPEAAGSPQGRTPSPVAFALFTPAVPLRTAGSSG